jgi:hypothetical protein
MRIVLLTVIATLCVGCGSLSGALFGGYDGELSTQAQSTVKPGATFAVVHKSGKVGSSSAAEESISRGLTQLGFVAVADPSKAEIVAEYDFALGAAKTRFRNLSNGFNNTNEMYTQTVYEKTFSISLRNARSGLIWEGDLSSEDTSQDIDQLAGIYVGQLLSHFGKTVTKESWFAPRFANNNLVAKAE